MVRTHVLTERDLVDIPAVHMPEPELVEVPFGQLVQVVDTFLFSSDDEVLGSIVVTLDGRFCGGRLLAVEVQLASGSRIDRL